MLFYIQKLLLFKYTMHGNITKNEKNRNEYFIVMYKLLLLLHAFSF